MKSIRFRALSGLSLLTLGLAGAVQAQTFSPHNVIVRVAGDGSAALGSAATVNFLKEFTPAGIATGSVYPLPTTSTPAVPALTMAGSTSTEGAVTLSGDGKYLLVVGYDAAPGVAGIAATTSVADPRVVGRFDWQNGVYSAVRITDAFSAGNIRAAASDNGSEFWTIGSNSGVHYVSSLSATATVAVSTTPANNRYVNIFNGQLYTTSASGTTFGVLAVGSGLPTTAGQTATLLNGFPTVGGTPTASPYDFYITPDGNTVYVSDDGAVTGTGRGGLQKWTKSSGTYTLAYTLKTGLTAGLRSLAYGGVDGSGNSIFYATDAATLTNLVTVTDSGAAATFATLATAATNTAFRGVEVLGAGVAVGPQIPAAPTLSAVADDQKVTLTWTASPGAASYSLYRSNSTGTETVYLTGLGGTSFTDTGLTNGTTYYYKVTASNAAGESPKSNEVSATPFLNPPAAPVLTASAATGLVQLSWTAPAHAVTYNLYRATATGAETSYKTGLTKTTFTDFGLTNGTTYYYQVTAVDAAGESVKSNEASAKKISVTPFIALSANSGNDAADSDLVNEGMYSTHYGISHRASPNYLNAEGVGQGVNGEYDGFFALRFDTTNIKNQIAENFGGAAYNVQNISLKLTESNAAFTAPGNVIFNLTSDNTTEFGYKYADVNEEQTTDPFNAVSTLAGEELLEVYPFTTTGLTNQFAVDTIPLYGSSAIQNPTNAAAGTDLLTAFTASSNRLTFVARPQDSDITNGTTTIAATPLVAATYNGDAFLSGTTPVGQPQLAVVATAAPVVTISGTATPEGFAFTPTPVLPLDPITVYYFAAGSSAHNLTNPLATQSVTINPANGAFSFTPIKSGSYDLEFKTAKSLSVLLSSVDTTVTKSGLILNLPAGDSDNNNMVDSSDFGTLIGAFKHGQKRHGRRLRPHR